MTSINGKRRRIGDDVVYFFIYLCAALSVVLLAGIIIYVFVRGIGQVNWQFLTSETSVLRGTVGIAGNLLNTLLHHNYHHAHSNSCRSGSSRVLE